MPKSGIMKSIILLSIVSLFHGFSFAFFDKWGFVKSEICIKFKIDYFLALDMMSKNDKIQKGLVYSGSDKEFKKTILIAGDQSKKAGQVIDRALKENCFKQSKACSDSIKVLSKEYLLISEYYLKLYSVQSSQEVLLSKVALAKKTEDIKKIEERFLKLSKRSDYWSTKRDLAVKNKDVLFTKVEYFCKPTGKVSL